MFSSAVLTTTTWLLAAAMMSQDVVFSRPVLLVVFDSINDKFIDAKMPLLHENGSIGQHVARARSLVSENLTESFPTLHTIATGVLPNVHGVIANKMFDNDGKVMSNTRAQFFDYDNTIVPLWAEAVRNNKKTATHMWPGSNFYDEGENLIITEEYKEGEPWGSRVTKIEEWFTKENIEFGMAYFEDTDNTESVDSYIDRAQNAIKELYYKLNGLDIDILILSNHGTKEVRKDHVLNIDDYVSKTDCDCEFIVSGPVSFIRFNNLEKLEEIYYKLKTTLDHETKFKVYKSDETVMDEWNLKDFELLKNTLFVATINGFTFYEKEKYEILQKNNVSIIVRENGYSKYDVDMKGILLAIGPSFQTGVVTEGGIQLTEVYRLAKKLLGLNHKASAVQKVESVGSKNIQQLMKPGILQNWVDIAYTIGKNQEGRQRN